MVNEWQRARDKRVEEAKKRQTVYSSFDYQKVMIEDIKRPMLESLMVILSPESSKTGTLKALLNLAKVLNKFESSFPEPQRGIHPETGLPYIWNPNSKRLIEYRDEFFSHCKLGGIRERILRAGINFIIIIYDYDPPYRFMIEWWAKKLEIKNWNHDIPPKVVNYKPFWWIEETDESKSD
jgi:hypothetical protein